MLVFVLAGCSDTGQQMAFLSQSNIMRSVGVTALREARLADGAVRIVGLSGYCVDRSSVQANAAVIMPCANLGARRADWPKTRAAFLVTVGQQGGADILLAPDATAVFLQSTQGRRMLSRTNDPKTIDVTRLISRNDAIYILVQDQSPNPFGQNHLRNWRAFTLLNGHLTTIVATGYGDINLAEDNGFALLQAFVKRLRAENSDYVETAVTRAGMIPFFVEQ
ncbi:hypothetical protein [Pseudaestuariivita rosea]|uniref:hypothetical protein n=1 Tax=Pseudaestuariivita rosea TaxID=2763263 RepID=UPI001ABBB5FE|nr:hypothetical protein [Pseudaestuariivita rosea]